MSRALLIPLLTLLPFLSTAQEQLFADSALWTRFHVFGSHVQAQPVRAAAAAPLNEYRLVWVEHDNGYHTSFTPGDSTITLQSMLPSGGMFSPGGTKDTITFYGERFAVRVRDVPVSMLDLTRWYFERR